MNIIPGRKVGNFLLSSPLQLYNNSHLIFSNKYIAIIFENYILLKYDSNQILTEIEVYKLENLEITIYNCVLLSPRIIPTFDHVYKVMGPTVKGIVKRNNYLLQYSGITFSFAIPQEFITALKGQDDLPFKLPDGTCLVLDRINLTLEVNSSLSISSIQSLSVIHINVNYATKT